MRAILTIVLRRHSPSRPNRSATIEGRHNTESRIPNRNLGRNNNQRRQRQVRYEQPRPRQLFVECAAHSLVLILLRFLPEVFTRSVTRTRLSGGLHTISGNRQATPRPFAFTEMEQHSSGHAQLVLKSETGAAWFTDRLPDEVRRGVERSCSTDEQSLAPSASTRKHIRPATRSDRPIGLLEDETTKPALRNPDRSS